jgi:hypothetical protein
VVALRAWLRERSEDGSGYLFTSQKGGVLDRTQFFHIFRAIAAAIRLSPERPHQQVLKHQLASHLVADNVTCTRQTVARAPLDELHYGLRASTEHKDISAHLTIRQARQIQFYYIL